MRCESMPADCHDKDQIAADENRRMPIDDDAVTSVSRSLQRGFSVSRVTVARSDRGRETDHQLYL